MNLRRHGHRSPRSAGAFVVALLMLLPAACGRFDLPRVGMPGSGNEGTAGLVEDRVWIDAGADAAPGSLRVFLGDGTLVMTSCVESYRLAPWRWVDASVLVWEEDGRNLRAEVVMVGREDLTLLIDLGGESVTRSYRAARATVLCPNGAE